MENNIYPVRDSKSRRGEKIEDISNGVYLSVIIPAYNEEKRLPNTLTEIDKYLSKQTYGYEIIVVNGGSKDGTAKVLEELSLKIKNLKAINDTESRGKGYAVKQGMLEAKGAYRVFTDADNSTPINQVEKMFPEFEKGYDIVIGSRDIKGAVLDPPQPWLRNVILGEGFKLYRKIIIGLWDIQDSQCGFKGFSKKATENIFPKSLIIHFAFDPEVLMIGRMMGYKIKEIPIYWKNDLASTVNAKSMIKMALDLFKIKWNLISGKYR